MIVEWLQAVEGFVLPNACVSCERAVGQGRPDALLCPQCRSRLRVMPAGGCGRCGQPLPPVGPCRFCAPWPERLVWVRSAVWLDPEARAVMHHLKYEGYRALGALAADVIRRTVSLPEDWRDALLVPVPLTRRRLRARGYNQAAVIADGLAAAWTVAVAPGLLERIREAPSQTALTPEERAANVEGAFVAAPPRQERQVDPAPSAASAVEGVRPGGRAAASAAGKGGVAAVILVDDVLTTGATLAAAAGVLEQAGWRRIGAVTFGRARPFDVAAVGP